MWSKHQRKRNFFPHNIELIKFLRHMKQLNIKVKVKMISINTLFYVEYILLPFFWLINIFYFWNPSIKIMSLTSNQCLFEIFSYLFKLSTLVEILPISSKNILNSLHVNSQSSLNLFCPSNFIWNIREISNCV